MRTTFNCSGVKHCEYLDISLYLMHHTKLTPQNFQTIIDLRAARVTTGRRQEANRYNIIINGIINTIAKTCSFFIATQKLFATRKACTINSAACQPVFQRSPYAVCLISVYRILLLILLQNVVGQFSCAIACSNARRRDDGHYWRTLQRRFYDEAEFLERKFSREFVEEGIQSCHVVEQVMSRKLTCGM